ncbi:sulfatase-like hydrolase/transferase [Flammeovirga sp. SubArs3]|uniref:sulfatase-like hydrolase/transferase n=1 Tax=Flammeovirga sp. SubArs3 TaxID=2995316 RepID=UPI00248C489F|nr:sulfatase-like hydrolase/transferase [Flammeovirga sp. SubArs3]
MKNININFWMLLFTFLLGGILMAHPKKKKKKTDKPNILIIQMDDMGFDDLSGNGNTVSKTPNIDQLAKTSVKFNNFYVANVCAPTRASLLTGRDFWRTGVTGMHGGNDYLSLKETTFAELLRDNGYKTGMWGKWHSGKAEGYWPWQRGFDEAYYSKLYNHFPSHGYLNGKGVKFEKWSDEQIVDMAIEFMEENKEQPFLAYVSSLSTHGHWAAPDQLVQKYMKEGRTKKFATLLAMQEFADQQIGRLLKYLETSGLDKETIVFFMSDNGPIRHGESDEEWALRNNHEYLGNKARNWKNGIKSPLYVKYKGVYEPESVDLMCSITDIYPTLLALTNTELPKDNLPIDGRNIEGCFIGEEKKVAPKEVVFANWYPERENKNQFAPYSKGEKNSYVFEDQRLTMISDDFKLIMNPVKVKNSPEPVNNMVLIDHKNDLLERTNIISDYPEIAASMKESLEEWFNSVLDEKDSFEEKLGFVGYPNSKKKKTKVFAVLTTKTIGFENQAHAVKFPKNGNGELSYDVMVDKAGEYTLTLSVNRKKVDKAFVFILTLDNKEYKFQFEENQKSAKNKLILKKGKQHFKIVMNEDSEDLKKIVFTDMMFELNKAI